MPVTGVHKKNAAKIGSHQAGKPGAQGRQHALSESERQQMVATAAYYIAEKRGFNSGDELADWLAAEEEIAAILEQGDGGRPH